MGDRTQKVFSRVCYASRKRSKLAPNGPTWASAHRDVVADVPSRSIGGLAASAATVFRRRDDFAARTLVLVAGLAAGKSITTSGTDGSSRGSVVSLVRKVARVYIGHVQSCFAGFSRQRGPVFFLPGAGQSVEKMNFGRRS